MRLELEGIIIIVHKHGKTRIGWEEMAEVNELHPTTIVQHWKIKLEEIKAHRAANVILSPGNHTYLDMKYTKDSPLGQT